MLSSNIYILSQRINVLEKEFLNDPRFSMVTGSACIPDRLPEPVDAVLIDGTNCLVSSQTLLARIGIVSAVIPRILFLSDRKKDLLPSGFTWTYDMSCCADLPLSEVPDHAAELWNAAFPALANAEKRRAIASSLLDEMKMKKSLHGYPCIIEGAAILSCTVRTDIPMKDWLYRHIATSVHSTPLLVERNIRTAIENTFLHGDFSSIQKRFGYTMDAEKGKPTNAEMLYMLAEHIRNQIRLQKY